MMKYCFERGTVEKISWIKGEPSWMSELRLAAWEVCSRAMPALEGLDLSTLQAYVDAPVTTVPSHEWPEDLQEALDERGDEEGLIVQRDSTVLSRSMTKEQSRKGVEFMDLDTAVKAAPELLRRYFAQQVTPNEPWAALHTAFWSGGSFLYVPPHVDVELPFHACYWSSTAQATLFPHTIIVAEAGSRVSLMDDHMSSLQDTPALSVEVVELWAREQARIYYYDRQNAAPALRHVRRQSADVARSAFVVTFGAEMGRGLQERELTLERRDFEARELWSARTLPAHLDAIEALFAQLPDEPLREKLRHYVEGKMSGLRPPLTLERIAQWHPEVR